MKTQIYAKNRIYNAKVLDSKGDYITVAYGGKVRREYNPAVAKQYQKKQRKEQMERIRKKVNILNTLPKSVVAQPNNIHKHEEKRALPTIIKKGGVEHDSINCRECMLNVCGECIGIGAVCEFFKYAPEEEVTAKSRRLMMQ